jgi:hypothetical protein
VLIFHGSSMAELANASVILSRDLGSNLGTKRKYFLILLVSHLGVNSELYFLNIYIDQSCWIPLGKLPKTINYNMYVERDLLKMYI